MTADIEILQLVATGIAQGLESCRDCGHLTSPYPRSLQRALNRLQAHGIVNDHASPSGVAELFEWARERPLVDWGLDVDFLALGAEDRLLYGSSPSALCLELAESSKDAELAISHQAFVRDMFAACQATGDGQTYVILRQHLIERPALTAIELQLAANQMTTRDLRTVLLAAYRPAGAESVSPQGSRATCSACGTLLVRTDGVMRCVGLLCKRFHESSIGLVFPNEQMVVELRPAIRRFVHEPGLCEVRLRRSLERAGWSVELWPRFDTYDLRAELPARGLTWAIDCKAWISPKMLADRLEPLPPEPSWTQAFVVVPDPIASRNRTYVHALTKLIDEASLNLRVRSESELLRAARNAAKPGLHSLGLQQRHA